MARVTCSSPVPRRGESIRRRTGGKRDRLRRTAVAPCKSTDHSARDAHDCPGAHGDVAAVARRMVKGLAPIAFPADRTHCRVGNAEPSRRSIRRTSPSRGARRTPPRARRPRPHRRRRCPADTLQRRAPSVVHENSTPRSVGLNLDGLTGATASHHDARQLRDVTTRSRRRPFRHEQNVANHER